MQTIEVTDEQYAFVQHLREEISEQVVGKYGYVRERDAVQFLIDNLDGDLELDEEEFDADDVGTDASTPAEADDSDDGAAVTFDESDSELEPEPDGASEDAESAEVDEDEPGDEESGDEEPEAADPDEDDEPDVDEAGADDVESDDDASESDDDGAADDDDMLNEMMSLLDTHEDKWDESASSDYRYSVELPDGTTEDVQTKDDVRALLFKHYR